jgi:hypothetical protein
VRFEKLALPHGHAVSNQNLDMNSPFFFKIIHDTVLIECFKDGTLFFSKETALKLDEK